MNNVFLRYLGRISSLLPHNDAIAVSHVQDAERMQNMLITTDLIQFRLSLTESLGYLSRTLPIKRPYAIVTPNNVTLTVLHYIVRQHPLNVQGLRFKLIETN